jgi:hypothetical protein
MSGDEDCETGIREILVDVLLVDEVAVLDADKYIAEWSLKWWAVPDNTSPLVARRIVSRPMGIFLGVPRGNDKGPG